MCFKSLLLHFDDKMGELEETGENTQLNHLFFFFLFFPTESSYFAPRCNNLRRLWVGG